MPGVLPLFALLLAVPSRSASLDLARDAFPELFALPASTSPRLSVHPPARADQSFVLSTPTHTFKVRALRVAAHPLHRDAAGLWETPDHFWLAAGADRHDEVWIVRRAAGTHRAAYAIELPPAVARTERRDGALHLLDARGEALLRFHPAEVRDRHRRSRVGTLEVERRGRTLLVSSAVSLDGLAPPLVIDPGWSSPSSYGGLARRLNPAALLPDGRVLIAGGETTNATALTSARLFTPATRTWAATGDLGVARSAFTATALRDGRVLAAGGYGTGSGLTTAELFDPTSGSWSPTGGFSGARHLHAAVLLHDGRVLVIGGSNGTAAMRSCRLFDPASGSWSATGSLATARFAHTATVLLDGRVLVVGGSASGTTLGSAERYDPATGSWSSAGSVAPRNQHSASLLADGSVLVVGGATSLAVERYDPAANSWSPRASLPSQRVMHSATVLTSGRLLVAGGYDSDAALGDAVLYDPAADSWSVAPAMTDARASHTATLLHTGRVLVTGGFAAAEEPVSSFQLYDPEQASVATVGALAESRYTYGATLLPSGEVLISSGLNGAGGHRATAERWSPVTEQWSAAGTLNHPRHGHTSALLNTGEVLIAGGNGGGYLNSAELYDPVANSWRWTGAMGTARDGAAMTPLRNGRVLVVGGANGGGRTATAELYDPATFGWSSTGSIGTARYDLSATLLLDGRVLAVGGNLGGGTISSATELYDPAAGTWTATAGSTGPRAYHAAVLLADGRVLLAGGHNGAGPVATAELFNPATGTFTATGALSVARTLVQAVSLPSGRVLLWGSTAQSGAASSGAELYDPQTGSWSLIDAPPARYFHRLVALADGRVLAAGGYTGALPLAVTHLFDEHGVAFARPSPQAPSTGVAGLPITITGTDLRARTRGSGSYLDASPTAPLLTLQAVANGALHPVRATAYSDTALTATLPAGLMNGYYRLQITAGGITGGRIVRLGPTSTPVANDAEYRVAAGETIAITFTAVDPEGDPVGFTVLTLPAQGALTGSGATRSYTAPLDFSGRLSLSFRASDGSNNSAPATITLRVAPPPPVVLAPASAAQVNASTLGGTCLSGATLLADEPELLNVSGAATGTSWSLPLSGPDGARSVSVTQTVGGEVSDPAVRSFVLDTAEPQTAIDSAPPSLSASASATFVFSASEAGASFECRRDAEPSFAPCASPLQLTALDEGAHQLQVRARDPAGNLDATPAAHGWTVRVAAALVFSRQPGSGLVGALAPVEVSPRTASGAPAPTASGVVTLTLEPSGVLLSGALQAPIADGVARFESLSISQAGAGYRLRARADGLAEALSDPFLLSAGAAVTLAFTEQPERARYREPLGRVRLELRDAAGNLAAAPAPVELTLEGEGQLEGTLAVDAPLGVATFDELRLRAVGPGQMIVARSGALEARSAPIEVLPVLQRLAVGCGCDGAGGFTAPGALLLWACARRRRQGGR